MVLPAHGLLSWAIRVAQAYVIVGLTAIFFALRWLLGWSPAPKDWSLIQETLRGCTTGLLYCISDTQASAHAAWMR